MKSETIRLTENGEEPQLFQETKGRKGVWTARFVFAGLILAGLFFFWPQKGVEGEAVLQAEQFAKMGLTSSGVLKKLFYEKGELVKKGEVIARFQNEELLKLYNQNKLLIERLNENKAILQEKIAFLDKEKRRKQILRENGAIGTEKLEEAVLNLSDASRELLILEKKIESAREEEKYLRSRVDSLELKAPFDGILLTDPGDHVGSPVKEGEFVLEMADPFSYFLEILVLEGDIHKIRIGDKAQARFHAFPWRNYSGKVSRIAPRTTEEIERVFKVRHVVPVEVKLEGALGDLRYGMRANLKIKGTGTAKE